MTRFERLRLAWRKPKKNKITIDDIFDKDFFKELYDLMNAYEDSKPTSQEASERLVKSFGINYGSGEDSSVGCYFIKTSQSARDINEFSERICKEMGSDHDMLESLSMTTPYTVDELSDLRHVTNFSKFYFNLWVNKFAQNGVDIKSVITLAKFGMV